MKLAIFLGTLALAGCAAEPADDGSIWTVPAFSSSVPQAPKLEGYKQLKSQGVEFRKYRLFHPDGLWTVRLDAEGDPIVLTMASGKTFSFKGEWYPEEGGADSAAVYAFTRGDETLIVLQGTSSMVFEETRIKFVGEQMTDLRRYAEKGPGMGEGAPGQVPKYREYPPR
jgi:hypothetical protein